MSAAESEILKYVLHVYVIADAVDTSTFGPIADVWQLFAACTRMTVAATRVLIRARENTSLGVYDSRRSGTSDHLHPAGRALLLAISTEPAATSHASPPYGEAGTIWLHPNAGYRRPQRETRVCTSGGGVDQWAHSHYELCPPRIG